MINERMKIGITGVNGFLGRNLKNRLNTKHEIHEFIGDVINFNDVEKFLKNDFDVVFHMAGVVPKYDKEGNNITTSYSNNQIGINNIAKIASKLKTKIIFPSSIAVYGNNVLKPITENTSLAPKSEYAISKMKSEEIIKKIINKNQLVILRFSNIYGQELLRTNLIESIANYMIEKKSLQLNLSSDSLLDFLFIEDAVTALELALKCTGIFNIGLGKSNTLKEIIKIFQEITSNTIPIIFNENNKFDIKLDISKAKIDMGFEPKIEMYEGIKRVLNIRQKL